MLGREIAPGWHLAQRTHVSEFSQFLEYCLGNRTHAANILGISIRTLRNKLKLYSQEGIPVPGPRDAERAPA